MAGRHIGGNPKAQQAGIEETGDDVQGVWVAGAALVGAAAFGVVAGQAGNGEVAGVIWVVADAGADRFGGAFAEPGLWHDVFQAAGADGLAIGLEQEPRAAVQTAGLPAFAVPVLGLCVGRQGEQEQAFQDGAHAPWLRVGACLTSDLCGGCLSRSMSLGESWRGAS